MHNFFKEWNLLSIKNFIKDNYGKNKVSSIELNLTRFLIKFFCEDIF